jgi:hypothetical protein
VLSGIIVGFAVKDLGYKKIVNKKHYQRSQFQGVITENSGSIPGVGEFDYLGVEEAIWGFCRASPTFKCGRMHV